LAAFAGGLVHTITIAGLIAVPRLVLRRIGRRRLAAGFVLPLLLPFLLRCLLLLLVLIRVGGLLGVKNHRPAHREQGQHREVQ
jgi:hypothetical protein